MRDWDAAEKANQEALSLKPDPRSIPVMQLNQAAIATGRGRPAEARLIYEQTIATNSDNPEVLWQAHAGLASLALAAGDWEQASQSFEAGIRVVEQSRSELNGPDNKITFLSRLISFYQDYVDALMDRNLPDTSSGGRRFQPRPHAGRRLAAQGEIGGRGPRRGGTESTGPPLRQYLAILLGGPAAILLVGCDAG